MPAGESAEGILVHSFGFGPKGRGDIPAARAAADGSFSFLATSDHGYALQIADSQWASDGWTGLILAEENSVPADISMAVYPAIPVEVHVARGPEHTPVANAWIAAHGRIVHLAGCEGRREKCIERSPFLLASHERTGGHPGSRRQRNSGSPTQRRRMGRKEGDQSRRQRAHGRRFLSSLGIAKKDRGPANAQRRAVSTIAHGHDHGRVRPRTLCAEPLKALFHEDGAFEVEGDCENMSVLVMDADKRMSAFAHIGPEVTEINLPMVPTAVFSGVLVNHQGEPLANTALRLRIQDLNQSATAEIETDATGRFHFDSVAADAIITLQVRRPVRGKPDYAGTRIASFAAGEKPRRQNRSRRPAAKRSRGQN